MQDVKEFMATRRNTVAKIAFYSAANTAALVDPALAQSLDWWCLGLPHRAGLAEDADPADRPIGRWQACFFLADFVDAGGPSVSAEALFRYASGRHFHTTPPDHWTTAPLAWKLAYEAFVAVLRVMTPLLEAEADRLEAASRRAGAEPSDPPRALPGVTGIIDPPSARGEGLIRRPKKPAPVPPKAP